MTTYGSAAGVTALMPDWDGSTTPTAAQELAWHGEAYAKINRAIGNAGYTTPVDSTAALYVELTGLENLYAAAYVLRSLSIDTASGNSEERSEVWLKDFYSQLADLANSNLSLVGATPIASTAVGRRRRVGTLQMRKVDGYSRGDISDPVTTGPEYTYPSAPAE